MSYSSSQIIELFDRYVIGNYTRYPVCLVRGEGSRVWDDEGNRYLDFFPGWGCGLLGHCPPRVVEAVQRQVAELIHTPGITFVGTIPDAVQPPIFFAGALTGKVQQADAGTALLRFLSSAKAAPVITKDGLIPMNPVH